MARISLLEPSVYISAFAPSRNGLVQTPRCNSVALEIRRHMESATLLRRHPTHADVGGHSCETPQKQLACQPSHLQARRIYTFQWRVGGGQRRLRRMDPRTRRLLGELRVDGVQRLEVILLNITVTAVMTRTIIAVTITVTVTGAYLVAMPRLTAIIIPQLITLQHNRQLVTVTPLIRLLIINGHFIFQ